VREVMRPFPAERPDYPLAPETVPSHSIKSSLSPICDEREERYKNRFSSDRKEDLRRLLELFKSY